MIFRKSKLPRCQRVHVCQITVSEDFLLEEMDLGEGSIVSFITPDGREITCNDTDTQVVFKDMECFQRALEDRTDSGYLETEWNNQTQLFAYSKIGTTGAMVCSMIPEQNITGQVQQIKQITIMITIVTALFSLIIYYHPIGVIFLQIVRVLFLNLVHLLTVIVFETFYVLHPF